MHAELSAKLLIPQWLLLQTGQFNKIAFVKKLLEESDPATAEWILYCEPEMVIDDPAFTFPFEFYAGR